MYKYTKKNAHNSTQNDKKDNKLSLQDTAAPHYRRNRLHTRSPFCRARHRRFAKKPCLHQKEALFGVQRSLVCCTKKPCLQPGQTLPKSGIHKMAEESGILPPLSSAILSAAVPRTPTCLKQNAIRRRAWSGQTDCRISAFLPATCLSSTTPAGSPSAPYTPPCS